MKAFLSNISNFLIGTIVILIVCSNVEAQQCLPSGTLKGTNPPPGQCNTENDSQCCIEGQPYKIYQCSPPVNGQTPAQLTLNSFEPGGDGGGAPSCRGEFVSDNTSVVALSTGWFDNKNRCNRNIIISGNGRSTTAMVVDECDSTMGCDAEHDYQPPCGSNTVDASKAVWIALGVPMDNWGQLEITWSDA